MRDRIGRFELADGGILLLDEIGEIPLDLQSELLRVLQEGPFERVGEERTRRVDVRIVATTSRNLREEVQARRFREDLYFRLNVFPIHSPALRARPEDIASLALHLISEIGKRLNLPGRRLLAEDLARLQRYPWPGNIRELQNVIERALITAQGKQLDIDLPDEGGEPAPRRLAAEPESAIPTEAQLRERENTLAALRVCQGRLFGKDGVAQLLGMKPTPLASRLKRLQIGASQL